MDERTIGVDRARPEEVLKTSEESLLALGFSSGASRSATMEWGVWRKHPVAAGFLAERGVRFLPRSSLERAGLLLVPLWGVFGLIVVAASNPILAVIPALYSVLIVTNSLFFESEMVRVSVEAEGRPPLAQQGRVEPQRLRVRIESGLATTHNWAGKHASGRDFSRVRPPAGSDSSAEHLARSFELRWRQRPLPSGIG